MGRRTAVPVGGHEDADPVEGVRRRGSVDAIQRHLAADQENDESQHRPQHFVPELNLMQSQNRREKANKRRRQ